MSIRNSVLPLLSRATASTSTSTAAFSTTAISQESKAKRKARLVKRSNLDHKAALMRAHTASTPDPVSGYAPGQSKLWDESVLKSILLRREDIWGTTVRGDSLAEEEGQMKDSTTVFPKYYNFGLNSASVELLTGRLPDVSATRSLLTSSGAPKVFDEAIIKRAEIAQAKEMEKRNRLLRIIDLKNADAKGITVENTRRIVETFGVKGTTDTGSPEVQGQSSLSFLL